MKNLRAQFPLKLCRIPAGEIFFAKMQKNALQHLLLACLATSLIVSCANRSATECVWVRTFMPDSGFEARWTPGEKRQAAAHNRKVAAFCR